MKIKISKGFLYGYGKAIDLTGATKDWPNLSESQKKDFNSLREDWESVGKSIRRETREYSKLYS